MIKFCSLFSGSTGNAIFIGTERTKILIDAGVSKKKIVEALTSIGENPAELSAVLVSHEHTDHTRGVDLISKYFNVPIYANEGTWGSMEHKLNNVKLENRRIFDTGKSFELDEFDIHPFAIPHDASDPVGFNICAGGKKITIATDIGHMTRVLLSKMEDSNILFLESNHDVEMLRIGPYPWNLKQRILGRSGHLSNEMASKVIAYLAEKGMKNFFIGHLSKTNNFPELAYQTVCNGLAEKSIIPGKDVSLHVALRNQTGEVVAI